MSVITKLTALYLTLLVVGLVLPYGFPLTTPLISGLFLLVLGHTLATDGTLYYRTEIVLVYLGAMGFVLIGTALSSELYANVRQDIINALAGLLMVPIVFRIAAAERIGQLQRNFALLLFLFMVPVALLCLYKFYMQVEGVQLAWLPRSGADGRYPVGSALQTDYNMAALGLTIGATGGAWLMFKTASPWGRWPIVVGVLLMIAAAVLTGSRRFYVVFALLFVAAFAYGAFRFGRRCAGTLARSRLRATSLSQLLVGAALVAGSVFLISPWIADLLAGGAFTRLFARADTLLRLADTLAESRRGALLEQSLQLSETFAFSNFLIGHGFDYLDILSEGGAETYPHNPLVAAFLHGGVPNLLLVIYVLVRSSSIYLSSARTHAFLCFAFFTTLVFTIISGNTIFSNRFFLMLLITAFSLQQTRYNRRRSYSRSGST